MTKKSKKSDKNKRSKKSSRIELPSIAHLKVDKELRSALRKIYDHWTRMQAAGTDKYPAEGYRAMLTLCAEHGVRPLHAVKYFNPKKRYVD